MSSLRDWPVWQLPQWLTACVTAVVAAYVAAVAWALTSETVRPGDFGLCAVLVGCGAVSVELMHRTGEQEGLARDVYAIWDLPVAGARRGIPVRGFPVRGDRSLLRAAPRICAGSGGTASACAFLAAWTARRMLAPTARATGSGDALRACRYEVVFRP